MSLPQFKYEAQFQAPVQINRNPESMSTKVYSDEDEHFKGLAVSLIIYVLSMLLALTMFFKTFNYKKNMYNLLDQRYCIIKTLLTIILM